MKVDTNIQVMKELGLDAPVIWFFTVLWEKQILLIDVIEAGIHACLMDNTISMFMYVCSFRLTRLVKIIYMEQIHLVVNRL